jgi:hypothetical protein
MYSGQNKTAGLKQPSGCMTAAACRRDFRSSTFDFQNAPSQIQWPATFNDG